MTQKKSYVPKNSVNIRRHMNNPQNELMVTKAKTR